MLATPQTTQNFLLKTSVSFVYALPGAATDYVPGVPPIWFAPDGDILYPFRLNAGARLAPLYALPLLVVGLGMWLAESM